MDFMVLVGVLMGMVAVLGGMVIKGANLGVFVNPEALLIIFVGMIAAVINSYPLKDIKRIPNLFKVLFSVQEHNPAGTIDKIVEMSNIARREGLLALEEPVQQIDNEFLKKGLEMVVDGIDADLIEEIMVTEIDATEERHRSGAAIFKTAGTTSPTLGVLGAVIGLIGALGDLSDVDKLGESISSAFVATLLGIFFGYVIMIPFSSRLTRKSEAELEVMNIILEGVLYIQAGQSPKTIEQKLYSKLEPNLRPKKEE
ncbi:flagellar motor stator protein MotA [Ligilactobacillus sp. WILCCON 0076]|uniref:Flagellar motor stator protein MotA n=1 Tax=Ligilactobacillus ubinensis TaxID=2876789 RepID=A0A9X2FLF5_9LACO|nr:flagellar motor stator protein MotA [Ligilactobacillus ubinensis]MCP0887824.1 flagellar motor stator protein MotA [Ligilactobacillus ubinensis]